LTKVVENDASATSPNLTSALCDLDLRPFASGFMRHIGHVPEYMPVIWLKFV